MIENVSSALNCNSYKSYHAKNDCFPSGNHRSVSKSAFLVFYVLYLKYSEENKARYLHGL